MKQFFQPPRRRVEDQEVVGIFTPPSGVLFESLILAQDERWRRALGMQVERASVARPKSVADG